MAARTPTAWTQYPLQSSFKTTGEIVETPLQEIINDIHMTIRARRMLFNHFGYYVTNNQTTTWEGAISFGTGSHENGSIFESYSKVTPANAVTVDVQIWALVNADAAGMEVRCRAGSGDTTTGVAVTTGSHIWHNLGVLTIDDRATGTDVIFYESKRASGAGTVVTTTALIGYAVVV